MDVRPISLVGEVYKFISKVLANRLERLLHRIISKPHNAFCRKQAYSRFCFNCKQVIVD